MQSVAILETSIDMVDPIMIMQDPDRTILAILRNKFEGRCFASSFIVKVLRVVKRSPCFVDKRNPSACTMSVVFEFTKFVIPQYSISLYLVTGSKNNVLICTGENCKFTTARDPNNAAIAVGDVVPLQAHRLSYKVFGTSIVGQGIMYVPTPYNIFYLQYVPHIDPAQIDAIDAIRDEIAALKGAPTFGRICAMFCHESHKVGKIATLENFKTPQYYNVVARWDKLELSTNTVENHTAWKERIYKYDEEIIQVELSHYYQMLTLIKLMLVRFAGESDYDENANVWLTISSILKMK
jgi:hypothetical protein